MSPPAKVAADLVSLSVAVRAEIHAAVVVSGAALQAAVKREASQPRTAARPASSPEGPRALTGSYRRTINRRTTRRARESTTTVGTGDRRGPWLELGTQRMRPYPHFGPALDRMVPEFERAVRAAHARAVAATRATGR